MHKRQIHAVEELAGAWTKFAWRSKNELRYPATADESWLFIGCGSSLPICALAARWFQAKFGVQTRALTPYEFENLEVSGNRAIIISAEGKNTNIRRAAQLLANRKIQTTLFSLTEHSPIESILNKCGVLNGLLIAQDPRTSFEERVDEFVPLDRSVTFCRMIVDLASYGTELKQIPWIIHGETILRSAEKLSAKEIAGRHLISIVSSCDGLPGALCLENALVETGRAAVTLSDPGNFRHGRFMILAENPNDAACLFMGIQRNDWIWGGIKLPPSVRSMAIDTQLSGGDAAMELMLRSIVFASKLQSAKPNTNQVKSWVRPLCDPPLSSEQSSADTAGQPNNWLQRGPFGDSYLPPQYYRKLLKPYSMKGQSDLSIYRRFLLEAKSTCRQVLELGAGDGRVTEVIVSTTKPTRVCLVDLSPSMCQSLKKFKARVKKLEIVRDDIIHFIEGCTSKFDHVVSLWSLSHAVHNRLLREGKITGEVRIKAALKKLFTELLEADGEAFLIHFDSLSHEQRISVNERKRIQPIFTNEEQSQSKLLLDTVLEELSKKNLVTFKVTHVKGDSIVFKNLDEALECYMNFHMEGIFNHSEMAEHIIESLKNALNKCATTRGEIIVKPAWFEYKIRRAA